MVHSFLCQQEDSQWYCFNNNNHFPSGFRLHEHFWSSTNEIQPDFLQKTKITTTTKKRETGGNFLQVIPHH